MINDFGGDGVGPEDEIKLTNYSQWITIKDGDGSPGGHITRRVGREPKLHVTSPPPLRDIQLFQSMGGFDEWPFNEFANSTRNFLEGFWTPANSSDPTSGRANHNRAHVYIGGHMRTITISANDPIFWLNHAFVDCQMQQWYRRELVRTGRMPDFGIESGAKQGHNYNDIMFPFFPFVSSSDRWASSLDMGFACEIIPIYTDPAPSIQQGDDVREQTLDVITNNLPPIPTSPEIPPPTVAVIGLGIGGMVAAYELQCAGFRVEGFEASQDVGGRAATASSEFTGEQRAERGPMRFPCSHWAVHRYAAKLGLPMRQFKNNNPEALFLLSCLDNKPVPGRVLNPNHESFDPKLWEQLYTCFGVSRPHERLPSGQLLDQAFQPVIEHVLLMHKQGKDTVAWQQAIEIFDGYSLREYLVNFAELSDGAVEMILTVEGLASLADVSVVEIFRDFIGHWWDDECYYELPADYMTNPLYEGIRDRNHKLWEFSDGSSALSNAFLPLLNGSRLHFGAMVTGLDYIGTQVNVNWLNGVNRRNKRFDFVVLAVPFTIMRTWEITPASAFRPSKNRVIRNSVAITSTKVLVQVHNRSVV
jgi:hypothetical protein